MAWSTPITHAVGDVLSAGDWNTSSGDLSALYGDLTWQFLPAWANGWGNYSTYTCGYRKVGTRIYFRGVVAGGTIGTAIFGALPTGYRPIQQINAVVVSNAGLGIMQVSTAGVVTAATGSNLNFSLEPCSYDTI